ncbi:MAG TPA: hypothetical protein DCQ64_12935 [Candidatus Rokubacteria bacterium]|nr:hypothetical protein [Candidatus Rokubacteria bacterium]
MARATQYPAVVAIAKGCTHQRHPDYPAQVHDGEHYVDVCVNCANAAGLAYRAARKAELAGRPKDCARCGEKPHAYTLAGWKLCRNCKVATMREHHRAAAKWGILAMTATAPMVDTSTWAGRGR